MTTQKSKEIDNTIQTRFSIQEKNFPVSQNSLTQLKNFKITKKIAKHGNQSIIVIPRILEYHLKPGTIVQLNIDVLAEGKIEATN